MAQTWGTHSATVRPARRTGFYRRAWLVAAVAAIIVSLAGLLLLVETSAVAGGRYEVQRLEAERAHWQEMNDLARARIARLRSLKRIEKEATVRLGMVPAKDVLFAKVPATLAPREEASEKAPAVNEGQREEGGWQGVARWVQRLWSFGGKG